VPAAGRTCAAIGSSPDSGSRVGSPARSRCPRGVHPGAPSDEQQVSAGLPGTKEEAPLYCDPCPLLWPAQPRLRCRNNEGRHRRHSKSDWDTALNAPWERQGKALKHPGEPLPRHIALGRPARQPPTPEPPHLMVQPDQTPKVACDVEVAVEHADSESRPSTNRSRRTYASYESTQSMAACNCAGSRTTLSPTVEPC
jgi:hypothetical protein